MWLAAKEKLAEISSNVIKIQLHSEQWCLHVQSAKTVNAMLACNPKHTAWQAASFCRSVTQTKEVIHCASHKSYSQLSASSNNQLDALQKPLWNNWKFGKSQCKHDESTDSTLKIQSNLSSPESWYWWAVILLLIMMRYFRVHSRINSKSAQSMLLCLTSHLDRGLAKYFESLGEYARALKSNLTLVLLRKLMKVLRWIADDKIFWLTLPGLHHSKAKCKKRKYTWTSLVPQRCLETNLFHRSGRTRSELRHEPAFDLSWLRVVMS